MIRKLYNLIPLILVIVMLLGLFLGPISWYFSHSIQSDYTEFISTAQKTTGVVYKKTTDFNGRTSTSYVSVRYKTPDRYITLASKVEVEPLMSTNLKLNEPVNLYYKTVNNKRAFVFEGAADPANIGPIYRHKVGMILTIYSYALLITLIIANKMKVKLLANPFKDQPKTQSA